MPRDISKCQCTPECKLPPLKGSPFCRIHKNKCSRTAPLSGHELVYSPDKYNIYNGIKSSNNCYSYALGYTSIPKSCTVYKCDKSYPQPGRASGYPKWHAVNGKRCPDVIARTMGDISGVTLSSFTQKCPANTRKVAVVTDPVRDYHWYRQDTNGYWSHKPGGSDVSRLDATQRPIYDPALASRKYPKLNYKNFCSYLCIPIKSHYKIRRSGGRRTLKAT
jgi:hypothetical protein